MKLTLEKVNVEDMFLGNHTGIKDGIMTVGREELVEKISEDTRIEKVTIDVAKPGESLRIFSVRDVIEPRVKISGNGDLFPGIMGSTETVGEGLTKVFEGAAVVTVGRIDKKKEGIIDMSGPGAAYTPFSRTHNLVLECQPVSGLDHHQFDEALRLAGLKTAHYMGEKCRDATPAEEVIYETLPLEEQKQQYPELPKIGYVYILQSQGLFYDTYVYGKNAQEIQPTLLYPTEVMDGAIINGNLMIACDKSTTYHHLNNPVIEDLYASHGKEVNFCGVIVTNHPTTLQGKERASDLTAKLAEEIGFDGVIISKEEYGNTDADLMMNCRKLEEKGIKTVLLTDEFAGRDGTSQSLADGDPKADAVVSTGNANERIDLPDMDKVIGNPVTDHIPDVEIFSFVGSTNELGYNKMGAKGY